MQLGERNVKDCIILFFGPSSALCAFVGAPSSVLAKQVVRFLPPSGLRHDVSSKSEIYRPQRSPALSASVGATLYLAPCPDLFPRGSLPPPAPWSTGSSPPSGKSPRPSNPALQHVHSWLDLACPSSRSRSRALGRHHRIPPTNRKRRKPAQPFDVIPGRDVTLGSSWTRWPLRNLPLTLPEFALDVTSPSFRKKPALLPAPSADGMRNGIAVRNRRRRPSSSP